MKSPRVRDKAGSAADKKASPNWRNRQAGMSFSDRIYYWLVTLGGVALIALGIGVCWLLRSGRLGSLIIGIGFALFIFGGPDQSARNGYRI